MRNRLSAAATPARAQISGKALGGAIFGLTFIAAAPSRACEFHWATGLPEPATPWPTLTSILTGSKPTTAPGAAALAVAQMQAQDAGNSAAAAGALAATPAVQNASLDAIGAWKLNWTGATGHSLNTTINALVNTTLSDVQGVWFDANYIYVKSADLPSYNVGNVGNNNTGYAKDQALSLRIPRNPVVATTPTSLGNGGVGVMVNGALMFDPGDAQTYNNAGVWHRIAETFESSTFDVGPAHVAPGQGVQPSNSTPGTYHYHVGPAALVDQLDPGNAGLHHSPIIGYAYDGFPVYGPYGYSDPLNPNSAIKRITTGYQIRTDLTTGAARTSTTLGGTTLTGSSVGPSVGASIGGLTYNAGCFKEDYQYVAGSGDLNRFNMRFEITPEYPNGTWAYYMTVDASGNPAFPYLLGPQYYGVVDTSNIGPTGAKVTIPAGATRLLAGDSNYDGVVDYQDLLTLERNFGKHGGALWSQGNFDSDAAIGSSDLSLLQQNYTPNPGSTFAADLAAAQASVPEPCNVAALALLGVVALSRRRNRASS